MTKLKNNYLTNARKSKNDEFYTRYEDIESEVNKFADKFKNKIVYCPCDNSKSNFVKFFKDNYSSLGLSGLYYSSIDDNAYFYDGNVDKEEYNDTVSIIGSRYKILLGKCDIVVTNPPFSLFVSFINGLVQSRKDFLIIGQQNTISCKDVFEHLIHNGVNVDYGFKGIAGWFYTPEHYVDFATAGEHKEGMIRVSGVIWYTTFIPEQTKHPIPLKESCFTDGKIDNDRYPFYDNFRIISGLNEDCINVNKVKDIPYDWNGYMGVPISFFGKYCPEQFELIQLDHYGPLGNQDNVVNGTQVYRRIYIRKRMK